MPGIKLTKLPKVTAYNENLALLVCYHIAMGGSLRDAAQRSGLPSDVAIYHWLFDEPDFARAYDRAQEIKARRMFDDLRELAATATAENNAAVRLRVDTDKWILAKMLPKLYGDKLQTDISLTMSLEQLVLDSIKLREEQQNQPDSQLLPGERPMHVRARNGQKNGHQPQLIEHEPAKRRGKPKR